MLAAVARKSYTSQNHCSISIPSDWIEFTPYEVGMAKYSTYMRTHHFGSKFFMGALVKEYEEVPVHYLMGLWGSAFSILMERLENESAPSQQIITMSDLRESMDTNLGTL